MEPYGVDCSLEAALLFHKIEHFLSLKSDAERIFTEMITHIRKSGAISIIDVYNNTVIHFPIGPMMENLLRKSIGNSV